MVKKQESLKWEPKVSSGRGVRDQSLHGVEEMYDGVKKGGKLNPGASIKIVGKLDHDTNVTPRFQQSQGEPGGPSHGESKSCG